MNDSLVGIAAVLTAAGAVIIEVIRQIAGRSAKSGDDALSFRRDLLGRIDKLETALNENEVEKDTLQQKYYELLVNYSSLNSRAEALTSRLDQLNAHVDELYQSVDLVLQDKGLDFRVVLAGVKTPRPSKFSSASTAALPAKDG
jgi:hypothetical protein